ncbi:MAG: hypothetical protein IJ498_04380 [Akkermansia sp.]|nr:hypothetical protein [Akkermansia sp.]
MLIPIMGFASIISAAGALASGAVQASAQRQQSAAYREAADNQWKLAKRTAETITQTALENQRRSERNARMQLASARADSAAGNLLQEGSVVRRELDLATRLEDEITNSTNAALQDANDTRLQGWYDRRKLLQQAGTSENNSRVSLLSGAVGALGALASNTSPKQ